MTRLLLRWRSTVIIVVLLATACGGGAGEVESPVTEDQAREMAENALQAFNDGDYAAWSRDWSDAMKAAIPEEAFLSFRDQFHAELGDYREITGVAGAQGADPGTYRWTFDVAFEHGSYRMWFGFKEGSPRVEGVSFEEPNS